jgi:ribosomal protein L11 methyltransferase
LDYIEVDITVDQFYADILIAELGEIDYSIFEEKENGFKAFIEERLFSEDNLRSVLDKYKEAVSIKYNISKIPKVNWNEEWEKNFHPVRIENKLNIRASFHPADSSVPLEIIINPKMSFGTGHHQTTSLMASYQLETDQKGKKVLDMGCGTGILAILAEKTGASEVLGIDIDDWTVENGIENLALNNCQNTKIIKGDVRVIPEKSRYDIILANINKNVLLEDMAAFFSYLQDSGIMLISGFYKEDINDLRNLAERLGLTYVSEKVKDRWAAVLFRKE